MNAFKTLVLPIAAAALVAGCGSSTKPTKSPAHPAAKATPATSSTSSGSGSAAGGTTLHLGVVKGSLMFDKTSLTARAGTITLVLDNADSIGHSIAVDGPDGKGVGKEGPVVSNGTSSTTFKATPGVYTYYCTVHEQQKMTGHLTVT